MDKLSSISNQPFHLTVVWVPASYEPSARDFLQTWFSQIPNADHYYGTQGYNAIHGFTSKTSLTSKTVWNESICRSLGGIKAPRAHMKGFSLPLEIPYAHGLGFHFHTETTSMMVDGNPRLDENDKVVWPLRKMTKEEKTMIDRVVLQVFNHEVSRLFQS